MHEFLKLVKLCLIMIPLLLGACIAPITTVKELCGLFSSLAFTIPLTITGLIWWFHKEIRFAMRYGRFRIGKNGVEISGYSEAFFDDTVKNIWDKNNERYKNCN